mmetsp:Transcript_24731/g.32293  ORF Transcript_24731/g.32293 Transcript_24731/m.32293 type:complete len:696 (-) Transcript_24731:178-2265(-)
MDESSYLLHPPQKENEVNNDLEVEFPPVFGNLSRTTLSSHGCKIRRTAFWLLIVLLIGGIGFIRNKQGDQMYLRFNEEVPLDIEISNEYPKLQSLEDYPWNYLVEPHRTSILQVNSALPNAQYTWSITLYSDSSSKTSQLEFTSKNDQTSEISAVFTKAGHFYHVKVVEEGGNYRSFETDIICKYVRREIRELTVEDREAFFDALVIFYTIPEDEGKALYGERFVTHRELTLIHVQEFYTPDGSSCTPWHAGLSFITAHNSMSLWVEQSLQRINPTIAIPYWNYIKDSEELGTDWSDSIIFTDDYYGGWGDYPFELSGRWSGIRYTMASDFNDEHGNSRMNSYGIITDWYNNNPHKFVQRERTICGVKMEIERIPSCEGLHDVLTGFSLASTEWYIEHSFHDIEIHELIGGSWDCPNGDLGDITADWDYTSRKIMENVLVKANDAWRYLNNRGEYRDPGQCNADIPFEDCRLKCRFEKDIETLDNSTVYEYLEELDIIDAYLTSYMTNSSGYYVFENVSSAMDYELKKQILNLYCNPASMGAFSSPFASPDDPIFWSIHAGVMRPYDYLQLTKSPEFSLEWDLTSEEMDCYGHQILDELPVEWFGFLGEKQNELHDLTYTNFDMLKLFDPANPRLPYVYAEFDWSFCGVNNTNDDINIKPEMYEGQVERIAPNSSSKFDRNSTGVSGGNPRTHFG